MENSLIPGIRRAIQSDKSILYDTRAERDYIMPILRGTRFIGRATIDVIDRQYADKINKLEDEIIDMGTHLVELEDAKNG